MLHQSSLIAKALRKEKVSRPPIWMMRQAGRYLPEYMELRRKYGFLDRCYNPEIAAEITLQPLRRFAFDAGIIFSDILLPLDKMGADLHYREGKGPQIDNPFRTREAVETMTPFDPWEHLPSTMEAIKLCKQQTDKPILGFAGAPFTLACYLVDGGSSKDWRHTKNFMWNDPEGFSYLLDKLAIAAGTLLQAQVDAGAEAVQLFDTWAGALSNEDFERFALPAVQKTFSFVSGAPTLYFSRDTSCFIDHYHKTGADAFAIDWRTPIAKARKILGDVPVQGNLDPIALQAPSNVIKKKVRKIILDAGPIGHIFNLGHGCTPQTPIEGVQAAIDAVLEWDWSEHG
jgi:uroporphyrinogen decarboxylase